MSYDHWRSTEPDELFVDRCDDCGRPIHLCECKADDATCQWCGQVNCAGLCPMGRAARDDARAERKAS